MKIPVPFFFFCIVIFPLAAQTTRVEGHLTDASKAPIIGANVLLVNTYDGATTDAEGYFKFETEENGAQKLQITYLGYDTLFLDVSLKGGTLLLNPTLQEGYNELKTVVISAGSFEASDEKKVTILKPLDIVTTSSANGDTYGALRTLPGTQVSSGDQNGLFVRGGTGSEAPTLMDGMIVRNPFFASTPDYAARGRFNPFLFKGTVFSTGGYSAQYGQGMSSVLVLESQDLPDRSTGSLSVSSVGFGYGQQQLWKSKNLSIGGNFNYTNLAPYFLLIKQRPNFTHKPESLGNELFLRKKTKYNGLLKFYGYFNHGLVGFQTTAADGAIFGFRVRNDNLYTNLTWSGLLQEHWKLQLGASVSKDWNNIRSSYSAGFIAPDTFSTSNALSQLRIVATRFVGKLTSVRFGGEYQYLTDDYSSIKYGKVGIKDQYTAAFVETDLYITRQLVARLGGRAEYSSLLGQTRLAPRVSLAYKLGLGDQISFAWGDFYQKGDSLLRWKTQFGQVPGFQKATHFILNYQYILKSRIFRIEAFYKKYENLVTTRTKLGNTGSGYAEGLEFFWRDQRSFEGVDYWISYSWLDTKRLYEWYPTSAQPVFAANHTATLVVKKFFTQIKTNVGITYNFATGRPYYNPNRTEADFLRDRTPAYHNLSVSLSYLTSIKKAFVVVVFGLQNALGQNQVFGYRYSADGLSRVALTPAAKRFLFVGAFASWGVDRRQEVINNQ